MADVIPAELVRALREAGHITDTLDTTFPVDTVSQLYTKNSISRLKEVVGALEEAQVRLNVG